MFLQVWKYQNMHQLIFILAANILDLEAGIQKKKRKGNINNGFDVQQILKGQT